WHVPTNDEWDTLINCLGGEYVAGGKLKETGTTHWLSPNLGATNETGFTALPGNVRQHTGAFSPVSNTPFQGIFGFWWTSTEFISDLPLFDNNAHCKNMLYFDAGVQIGGVEDKAYGFSVRCIKDLP
ncbi:MAG TPA: FISUMP domain-containing protein, partial [Flavitalea sp.]|nr:FISUMP domain-containing protein [Flavitalea sp.]